MRSLYMNIEKALPAYRACKGILTAIDAADGSKARVVAFEGRRLEDARLVIRFEDGTERVFTADNDRSGGALGSYFEIAVLASECPECEPFKIEIYDGGRNDYEVHAGGSGSAGAGLALTIVNEGAEERNAPVYAAWKAERERASAEAFRLQQERLAAQEAERKAGLQSAADAIAARLNGKRVLRVEVAGSSSDFLSSLALKLDDGRTMRIGARLDHALEIEMEGP